MHLLCVHALPLYPQTLSPHTIAGLLLLFSSFLVVFSVNYQEQISSTLRYDKSTAAGRRIW